ncbi:unnamed protein product, partial [marine sediment metagenome]
FRILVLAAAGLMLVSWFMPWWAASILELGEAAVVIRPWGLEADLREMNPMIAGSDMPVWFAPLMWTYLGICIGLLLLSLLVKGKAFSLGKFRFSLPKVLIGGVGLSYIVVVVLAVIIAAIRTGDFYNVKLIGYSFVSLGESYESGIESGLQFGYWLASGVGSLLIVLALFRNKIVGKRLLK